VPIYRVQAPDGSILRIEGPDNASEADLIAHAQQFVAQSPKPQALPEAAAKPEFSLPGAGQVTTPPTENGFNLPATVISAGRALTRVNEGIRQANLYAGEKIYGALGLDKAAQENAAARAEQSKQMAGAEKAYAPLQATHPGSTMIGDVLPFAAMGPELMAATAASSYGSPEERAKSAGAVLLGNKLAQGLGKSASRQYAQSAADAATAKAQNAVRDQTLRTAQDAGFRVPPATVNPSFLNNRLESLSGKAATQQSVALNNASVANKLIRGELGLPASAPITETAVRGVRKQAYQTGYEPIAKAGKFNVSPEYNQALDSITAQSRNAAESFPGAATPEIRDLVDSYRPPSGAFDAGHALEASQILRNQAREAFRKGDNAIGQAKIAISEAIQNEIERQLTAAGKPGAEMLAKFKDARALIAKSHSVEDSIRTGTGFAEASKLAGLAQKGAPLSGNLKLIGEFANAFPKANQSVAQIGSPGVSKLEAAMAGLMGAGGTAVGGPVGGFAAASLPFVAPPAARALILSPVYQKFLAKQKYPVKGLLGAKALDNEVAPYLAGLLSYEGATR
jgi:hypothetical protein